MVYLSYQQLRQHFKQCDSYHHRGDWSRKIGCQNMWNTFETNYKWQREQRRYSRYPENSTILQWMSQTLLVNWQTFYVLLCWVTREQTTSTADPFRNTKCVQKKIKTVKEKRDRTTKIRNL
jgi:hypothetical protein